MWKALIVGTATTDLSHDLEESLFAQPAITAKRCIWPECRHQGLPIENPDLILAFPPQDAEESDLLFRWVSAQAASVPWLAILPEEPTDKIVQKVSLSADDFVIPPIRVVELMSRVRRLLSFRGVAEDSGRRLSEELGLGEIVTRDPQFRKVIQMLPALSRTSAPVLLYGETGTGKELCARALHHLSRRSSGPFVPVDCGTIPDHLLENELFGHARGAFTDAHADQRGLVALANNGTLFLDEIDSLSLSAQSKLLRFLQEGTYRPLGSERLVRSDARVIAATNGNLELKIQHNQFRSDLYYRLNVLSCNLPPLRERAVDIALLAQHFLDELCSKYEHRSLTLSPGAVRILEGYAWPGNVRELFNLMQRVVALVSESPVLPNRLAELMPTRAAGLPHVHQVGFREARARALESFDRQYLESLLRSHHGNVTRAAQEAGKDRRVFGRLLKKYRIERAAFTTAGPKSPIPRAA